MTKTSRTLGRRRRAATVVEFAFVVPIIFTFLFASLEFSRASSIRNTARNAAYEGARQGIVPGATADEAETAAREILAALRIQGAEIDVTPATITPSTVDITVTVTVPLESNSYVATQLFQQRQVEASCTLRREEALARLPE